jgi:hypothetical protein
VNIAESLLTINDQWVLSNYMPIYLGTTFKCFLISPDERGRDTSDNGVSGCADPSSRSAIPANQEDLMAENSG